MKSLKIAMTILFILAILSLTGCNKTYFFSFRDEQSLSNSEGDWILEEDEAWGFTSKGFTAEDANVACPFRFSGDFTYIVTFYLNADENHTLDFGICLGDGTWYDTTDNDIHIEFYDPNTDDAGYYIEEHDGTYIEHYNEDGDAPGLNTHGYNDFKLVKRGEKIRIFLNDVEYANFELSVYESEWFGPNVWVEEDFPLNDGYGFFLESVGVVYPTGNISDMPYID